MTNPYDPDPRDGLYQIPPAQFRNTHQLRLPAHRTSWKLFVFSERGDSVAVFENLVVDSNKERPDVLRLGKVLVETLMQRR